MSENRVLARLAESVDMPRAAFIPEKDSDHALAPAFDALLNFSSVRAAAKKAGVLPVSLWAALEQRPEFWARVKARREQVRELVLLRGNMAALTMLEQHEDGEEGKELTPRDVTDILRAANHGDKNGSTTVNIVVPPEWLR